VNKRLYDVGIIGAGPAGVQAALYAARAGLSAIVFTAGPGELGRAHLVENYYGLPRAVTGKTLYKYGLRQLARVGAEVVEAEVIGVSYASDFLVQYTGGALHARCVIIATGRAKTRVALSGLAELEGKGVSYCAVCDGFFYKNKPVAVLGAGEYAAAEASHLAELASCLTVLTNGAEPALCATEDHCNLWPADTELINKKIASLQTDDTGKLAGVLFEDGSSLEIKGLFVAVGTASAGDLARKLGCELSGGAIAVDEHAATNLPGLFAAGDCTGGIAQISTAVGQGAAAGLAAVKFLRGL